MTGLWARRPDPFCLERLHDSDDAACPKQGIEALGAGAGEGPLALHRVCVCGVARASNEAPLLPLPLTVGSGPSSPMMFSSSELYLHNRPALGFSSHPESNLSPRDGGGPGAWVPASPLSPAASYRPRILRLPRRGFCCRHFLSLEFISPDMSELRPHDAFHCSPSPSPTNQQTAAAVLTTGTGTKTAFPAVLEGVPAGPRTRLSGRRRDVDRVSLSRTRGHVSFTLTRTPLRSRMAKHPSGVLIDFVGTHPQSSFQSNHFLTLHLVKTLCANDTFRTVTCHYVFVQTHRRCHTEREP